MSEQRKALEDARRVIHDMIKDAGGCDHDVGICVCEWIELCDRIDDILTEPEDVCIYGRGDRCMYKTDAESNE